MAPNPSAPTKYAEATLVEVPLKQLAALQVQQQKEMLEAALNTVSIGYEGANKYKVRVAHKSIVAARHCWVSPTLSRTRLTQVRDPAGRPIYFVVEDSSAGGGHTVTPAPG